MRKMPWDATDRESYREDVLHRQVILKKNDTRENWQNECSDFINKCIKRKTNERLGLNGATELKNHIWFREFDWRALQHRKTKPAWTPSSRDNYPKDKVKKMLALRKERETQEKTFAHLETVNLDFSFQEMFDNFYFDRDKQMQSKRAEDPMHQSAK